MKTILLIDAEAEARTLLAQYLSRNNWRVWEAEDGRIGLELAKKYQPAAVLCDLQLPYLSGFKVCAAIRKDHSLTGTHVLAMSAKAYPKDRKTVLDAGAEEFFVKPVSPPALLKLLGRLVREPPVARKNAEAQPSVQPTSIKFWGVRGSIPTPGAATVFYGGNTPCVEVRAKGEIVILDAGTGIRGLGAALAAEFKHEPLAITILLTHTHWDHIQGFPFFAPIYDAKNRIRILGYEGARDGVSKVLSNQMESPHFPVSLDELPGHISIQELTDLEFAIGELKVRAGFARHPGLCLGYRLETEAGPIVYLPDNEPVGDHAAVGAKAQKPRSLAADKRKMIEFCRNAEVLILDAQYDREEYEAHQGWGHGCVEDAVSLAIRARARRLYLFHHDPDHSDQKIGHMLEAARKLASSKGARLVVEAAREGERLEWNANQLTLHRNLDRLARH